MALPASDLTKKPDMRTTMELGAVLPETAEVRDDHLFIGGVDAKLISMLQSLCKSYNHKQTLAIV